MERINKLENILVNRKITKENVTVVINKLEKYVNETIYKQLDELGYTQIEYVEVSTFKVESIVKKYYCANIFYAYKYTTKAKEIMQGITWDSQTCMLSYGGNNVIVCDLPLPQIKELVLNAINYSLLLQGKQIITMHKLEELMRNSGRFTMSNFGIKDQLIIYTDNLIDGAILNNLNMFPTNLVYKRWITKEDSRVRPSHKKVNKKWINHYEKFIVGGEEADYPRDDRLSLKEKINCRCKVEYKKG